jgi:hypothetical protein
MAIYHLSVKNIGRSDGRSAVACAAYRAGEKLIDKTYGKEQDYTKKTGVEFKKIYAPENAKKELLNRESLWNAVEKSETKKNGDLKETARLAKEFEVAFPCEISKEQRELMLDDLCKRLVEKHGVIVDAVIHAPHTAGGSDERNYHAHIMFTTRTINERGELGKKAREFNDDGRNLTVEYRAYWAELENRELERAGSSERVSHLSNKERGIDLEPTVHEGSKITELRRQGIDTEISLKNDAIKARNAEIQLIRGLEQEIIATERLVASLHRERVEQSPQHSIFDRINQNLDVADSHISQVPPIDKDRAKNNVEQIRQAFQKAQELAKLQKEQAQKDRLAQAKAIGEQEQRQKENQPKLKKSWSELTAEEKQKRANAVILRYNATVSDKSSEMAHDLLNREKIEYSANQSEIEHVLKQIEQEKQNLGKRSFWGGSKWDSAMAELETKQKDQEQRKEKLLKNRPILDESRCREQARNLVNKENPQLKQGFDNACRYLGRQTDEQKRADQQKRLEEARRIGEQERANKAQLDKEREQRAEERRQQRPRY